MITLFTLHQNPKVDTYTLLFKWPLGHVAEDFVFHMFANLVSIVPKESHFSNQAMVKFIENGGNILVGLTPSTGEQMRDFVREFDVELDSRNHRVFDDEHFISKLDNGAHDTISTKSIVSPKTIVDEVDTPILFRGIGHRVGKIPLLSRVLVAENGAYTGEVGDSKDDDRVVELVSAMQARNNARVTIAGSLDLFSDS